MRPTKNLKRLVVPSMRQMRRLWILLDSQALLSVDDRDPRIIAYSIIELQNTWIEFLKNFYLSCTIRAHLLHGGRIKHRQGFIARPQQALAEAVYVLNPRFRGSNWRKHRGPNWIQPTTLITLTRHFGFSNQNNIYAAMSYQPHIFNSLPELRNYFAHKNVNTYRTAMNLAPKYGIRAQNPTDIVLAYAPNRPQTIVQDWINDLIFVMEYLCS